MKLRTGTKAWLGLALYIVAYDVWAICQQNDTETMSEAFTTALKHPYHRAPVILAWAYITGHLFTLIPPKLDPLRMFNRD